MNATTTSPRIFAFLLVGLLAAAAAYLTYSTVRADSARENAAELMRLFDTETTVQLAVQSVINREAIAQPDNTAYIEALQEFTLTHLAWERLEGEIADVYVETFSAGELEEIVAFFNSPAGASFIRNSAQVSQRIDQRIRDILAEHGEQLDQLIAEHSLKALDQ